MRLWYRIPALAVTIGSVSAMGAAPTSAEAPAACPAAPVLPPDLADWARGASSKTIYAYGADLAADWSPLGPAKTELPLHRAESLRYWIAPERKPDVYKFGGMIPIVVEKPGRLVVALDAGAWIDLVRDGAAVKSATHGHGPACSGIRKMVEFDVTRGRYLLQIVNAPTASIHAMAVLRD